MADGRMLKKAISTSRKLAELKSDTCRLLYTWILPHLDIDGRFFGDPDIIKGSIVPRIRSITPEIILECLTEMQQANLLLVYQADNDVYLQYTKFSDHQRLDPKKEAKSKIPAPIKTKRKCFTKEQYDYAWNIWKKNGMKCPECGKSGEFVVGKGIVVDGYVPFHIDHIIPISKGGEYEKTNLRVICRNCNLTKGEKFPPELLRSSPELIQSSPELIQSSLPQEKLREVKRREDNKKKKFRDFVFLLEDEYQKLTKKFGEAETNRMIENLDNYIGAKGKRYKDHYRTILMWKSKEEPKEDKYANIIEGQ